MPLVRLELRNEYGLGAPEMYRKANEEEPKEILEAVAVAGLVGVLRQLGDLADFAAEVFHGLQEEVMITSSRSQKLMGRAHRIEAALSPLEKSIMAQRSHLHFAYTAGSHWHARIQCEENHFVYSDVPQFVLDSYEDCRGPPRFYLLDRFDPSGPGSCLKRYSDPTFFKRASVATGENDKVSKDKKGKKIKKRRSWRRNRELSHGAAFPYHGGRMQFTQSDVGGHTSPYQPMYKNDATLRSDLSEQSNLDLRNGSDYTKGGSHPSCSTQPREQDSRDLISSPVKRHHDGHVDYNFLDEKVSDAWDDDMQTNSKQNLESFSPKLDIDTSGDSAMKFETVDETDIQTCSLALQTLESGDVHLDDFENGTDNFMDAINTVEPEPETGIDFTRKKHVDHYIKLEDKAAEDTKSSPESQKLAPESSNVASVTFWTNGGLLGLQPSKPPDGRVLNDLSQDQSSKKYGKIMSSSQHLNDKDAGKPEKTESLENIEEGLDTDEQENHQNFGYRTFYGRAKHHFGSETLIISPSSSPPLAHMKISFQPIDGFEMSKLKLKFPDGDTNDISSKDTFPSFQLVLEMPINQRTAGSDSDDDTFSRSSPSLSKLELWETGESATGRDPHLYDSLGRISLSESVSTVPQHSYGNIHGDSGLQLRFVENSMQKNSHSCLFDLQSLDALNHSSQEEVRNDTNSKDLVEQEYATAPDPPPLPPVQWRGVKPHLDDTEDMREVMPKGSNYAFDLSKNSLEPKPAPLNHDQILQTTDEQKSKQFGTQKSNGRGEVNHGKSIDENEDFLHQIRTNSFNLKPTIPVKQTVPSECSSNFHVTAILEKANAIRQAVGSDDGVDDDHDRNWSEQ